MSTNNSNNIWGSIITRKLQTQSEIKRAENLLYEVYCKELQWTPLEKNPSNYRIEESEIGKTLTDKYSTESFWIGAFYQDKLIGCCRLLHSREFKNLELHQYFDAQCSSLLDATASAQCEVNRLTVHKQFRGKGIVLLKLMRCGFHHLLYGDDHWRNVSKLLSSTPSKPTMKYLKWIGADVVGDFKYHQSDPKFSYVFVLHCSNIHKLIIIGLIDLYLFYHRILFMKKSNPYFYAFIIFLLIFLCLSFLNHLLYN